MTHDTTLRANTLTQLSSREQLSALMDGALPADETRFLLRRLQHDAPLAECWERWRLSGEVMRGLAPAQRLPADFATRVSAAIFDEAQGSVRGEPVEPRARKPAWLRWGGGAAMAASLAVVVGFVARQPAVDPAGITPQTQIAAASTTLDPAPVPSLPEPTSRSLPASSETLVAATAIAAAARPQRSRDAARNVQASRAIAAPLRERPAESVAAVASLPIDAPQPDIVTRPWPRSALPQYAGNNALTVGFGEHDRVAAPYNPFQAPGLADIPPPAAAQDTPADAPATAASRP